MRKTKLAVYFAVVKNFKHVTVTCSKATFLSRNPSCKADQKQSRSPRKHLLEGQGVGEKKLSEASSGVGNNGGSLLR